LIGPGAGPIKGNSRSEANSVSASSREARALRHAALRHILHGRVQLALGARATACVESEMFCVSQVDADGADWRLRPARGQAGGGRSDTLADSKRLQVGSETDEAVLGRQATQPDERASPFASHVADRIQAACEKGAQRQQIEMADRLTKLRERLARDAKVGKAAKAKKDEQDGNVEPPR
jgi:hypothetical protein